VLEQPLVQCVVLEVRGEGHAGPGLRYPSGG
jgi:hypothetical protein